MNGDSLSFDCATTLADRVTHRASRSRRTGLMVMLAVVCCGSVTAAEPLYLAQTQLNVSIPAEFPSNSTAQGINSDDITFRRVFVPESIISKLFPDYLPLHRATFEAEIRRFNGRIDFGTATPARIVRAIYTGKLVGEDLLVGEARWTVQRSKPVPARLVLAPCGLSLGSLHWDGDPQVAVNAGLLAGNGTAGWEPVAIVDRDGTLVVPWSLRGARSSDGVRTFAFGLPPCATNQVALDLPQNLTPRIDAPPVEWRSADPQPAGIRRWVGECGGQREFSLALVESPAAEPSAPLLRESLQYRLTTAGLELRATLRITNDRRSMDRLIVEKSADLYLAAARMNDRSLPLLELDDATAETAVQILLPGSLSAGEHEIVILAYAARSDAADWELPRLRLRDVSWQQGQSLLEVVDPLRLVDLKVEHGLQTKVEPLPAPEQGELRQIQFWEPSGRSLVRVAVPPTKVEMTRGTAVRVGETALIGRIAMQVQARRGAVFELEGRIHPGWIIDGVQTEPPGVLEGFRTQTAPRAQLRIRFKQAIPTDQPWQLVIRAHRRGPRLNQPVLTEALRIVDFTGLSPRDQFLAISAEPPLRMTLIDQSRWSRLDPQSLPVAATEALQIPAEAVVLRDEFSGTEPEFTFARELPRFGARLEVEARVDAQKLTESVQISCEPQQSHIPKLLVQFATDDTFPWDWHVLSPAGNGVSTRLVTAPGERPTSSMWEVSLMRPTDQPFVLRAMRRRPMTSETALTLASVPDAATQTGTLRVFAMRGEEFNLHVRNLRAIGAGAQDPMELPTLRGAFRFDPSEASSAILRPNSATTKRFPAWIWSSHTETQVDESGAELHVTRLLIENAGLEVLPLTVARDARLREVFVNGEPQIVAVNAVRVATIPLPSDRRFPEILVIQERQRPALGVFSTVRPLLLQTELPCLDRRWTVWSPADYDFFGQPDAAIGWEVRLFGYRFLRRDGSLFNPFSRTAWNELYRWPILRANTSAMIVASRKASAIGQIDTLAGWHRCELPWHGADPLPARLVRKNSPAAVCWGLAIIAVGVTAACARSVSGRRRIGWFVLASCVSALLLPSGLFELARALLGGSLLGLAIGLLRPGSIAERPSTVALFRTAERGKVVSTATVSLLVCFFWFFNADVRAQEAKESRPSVPRSFNVLIPTDGDEETDEKQQPKGDYWYVPRAFYDLLFRRGADLAQTGSVLIQSADYRLSLAGLDEQDARRQVREFQAEYELLPQVVPAKLSLPWRHDRLRILEVTLDGQSLTADWNDANQHVSFEIPSALARRLRIVARPLFSDLDIAGEWEQAVPPVPSSRVTVNALGAVERIEVPAVRGSLTRDEATGDVVAELGPSRELRVRWNRPQVVDSRPVETDAVELLWWRVQPNSLILDATFKLSARHGSLGQADVRIDRGLRLLPLVKQEPLTAIEMVLGGGDAPTVRCWFDRPYEAVSFQLSFELLGGSGLGHLPLPRVASVATHRAPVWLGLTIADGLTAKLLPEAGVAPISVSDFAAGWGQAETPHQAFSLSTDARIPRLATRPVELQLSAWEKLDVLIGLEQATLDYEATLQFEHGSQQQQTLHVPRQFEARDVTVVHDDANRLLRWSKVDDETINLFFTAPLTGSVQVWIKGVAPLTRGKPTDLGLVSVTEASARERHVHVFQEPNLGVACELPPGWQRDDAIGSGGVSAEGRRWLTSATDKALANNGRSHLIVSVRPERPQAAAMLRTRLMLVDDAWHLETTVHVTVQAGTVDTLRFHVPEELVGELQVSNAVDWKERSQSGEPGRTLIVRLPPPVEQKLSVTWSGKLSFPTGAPVHLPNVRLLDEFAVASFVVLPPKVRTQQAAWSTSGLRGGELPPEFALPPTADVVTYRETRSSPEAILKEIQSLTSAPPRVALADYQVRVGQDRRYQGVATFYLEPSRLTEIALLVPKGCDLVQSRVAGVTVAPRAVSPDRWLMPVTLDGLPQLIEVLFEIERQELPSARDQNFAAPVLADLPVEQTLWTVYVDADDSIQPLLAHARVSPEQCVETRAAQIVQWRETVAQSATQEKSEERAAWLAEWDARLGRLSHARTRMSLSNPAENLSISTAQGNRSTMSSSDAFSPAPAWDLAEQWQRTAVRHDSPVCGRLLGEARYFSVIHSNETWQPWLVRGGQATLLLILVGGIWGLVRRTRFLTAWHRSPQLAVALGGLVWWWLATPSVVGLFVTLAAGLSALRSRRSHDAFTASVLE